MYVMAFFCGAPRSLGGLSNANDRAGAAFTVGPVREMAIAYA